MGRSTNSLRAERINTALGLLQQSESLAVAARTMVETYGMSKRQAYRYMQEAQAQPQPLPLPLPIPQQKIAFTVKLPPAIVEEARQHARQYEQSLSQLVEQALEAYFQREDPSG